MHPDVAKLVGLQKLDAEVKRLREAMDGVPRHLAEVAARSAAAQGEAAAAGGGGGGGGQAAAGAGERCAGSSGEGGSAAAADGCGDECDAGGALEHEIAFLAGEVRGREDAELDSMVRSESFEAELAPAIEANRAAEAMLELERRRGAEEMERGRARGRELEAARAEIRPTVTEAVLGSYDRIARSRGTAMAEGVDGGCSGCRMKVRPQMWNELRDRSNDDRIFTCESCGRMLYWDPARDAPQRKPAEREESIAARIVRSL